MNGRKKKAAVVGIEREIRDLVKVETFCEG